MEKTSWYLRLHGGVSRTIRIGTNVTLVLLALTAYGLWNDFITTSQWRLIGFYLTCVLTTAITITIYYFVISRKLYRNKHQAMWKNIIGFISIPVFLYFLIWIPLVFSVPDIMTISFGTSDSVSTQVNRKYVRLRKLCDYHLSGGALNGTLSNNLCITQSMYADIPAKPHIVLYGKRTYFGFHIDSFQQDLRDGKDGL